VTRPIHHTVLVLLAPLLFSACEKKSESSSSSSSSGGTGSGAPTKSTRTERHGGTRAEREAAAKSELAEALDSALKEPDPAAREKAIAQVAWDAIDVDRRIAEKAFQALTPGSEESRKLVAHFAMRLADQNPEAALEWASGLEEQVERDDALSRVAAVIAGNDPTRASDLVKEIPEGLVRNRAIVQVSQRWSQTAPKEAGTWLASLSAGHARKAALTDLAKTWSETDAAGFANWASTQETQLPEMLSAVADALRTLPDSEARAKRMDSFSNPAFREQVEAELKKSPIDLPTATREDN
jgi:hypothetical protein